MIYVKFLLLIVFIVFLIIFNHLNSGTQFITSVNLYYVNLKVETGILILFSVAIGAILMLPVRSHAILSKYATSRCWRDALRTRLQSKT